MHTCNHSNTGAQFSFGMAYTQTKNKKKHAGLDQNKVGLAKLCWGFDSREGFSSSSPGCPASPDLAPCRQMQPGGSCKSCPKLSSGLPGSRITIVRVWSGANAQNARVAAASNLPSFTWRQTSPKGIGFLPQLCKPTRTDRVQNRGHSSTYL